MKVSRKSQRDLLSRRETHPGYTGGGMLREREREGGREGERENRVKIN